VSSEHFAKAAYFDVVSFPSKPSSKRLMTVRCSLSCTFMLRSQKPVFSEHGAQRDRYEELVALTAIEPGFAAFSCLLSY